MTLSLQPQWMELLWQALGSERGICLSTSDVPATIQALNRHRKAAGEKLMARLIFSPSPFLPEEEVWIHFNGKERG